MRQSITTKYIGPTNFRGSRVKATASGGSTITLGWDDALNSDANHIAAANALMQKLGWDANNRLIGGDAPKGCVFVLVEKPRSKK